MSDPETTQRTADIYEMSPRDELLRRCDERADEICSLAADLISIPSENPPGDVTEVMDFAERYLRDAGHSVERMSPAPGRHNLVATVDSGRPGPHVVLNAHLDVFPIGDESAWTRPPLARTIEGDTIYGRGACDMKGGAAAFIAVLRLLDGVRDVLRGRVTLTLVCDEETFDQYGAIHLLDNRPDLIGDVLLSTEPSSLGVVRYAEKGLAWGECTFRGRGGHAAYPHAEPTAIESAAAFICALPAMADRWPPIDEVFDNDAEARARYDAAVQPGGAEAITRVVINAGVIRGGTSVNMLPDLCTVRVDLRVPLGMSLGEVVDPVRELAGKHGGDFRLWNESEPNASDRDHPIFGLLRDHAESVTGIRPLLSCGLGCTDARLWRRRGVPSAVYGPAPTGMGGPDERITRGDLLDLVRVHSLAVADFLAADG
jgi:succinyl-diaminopimelate desuccinylase